MQIKTISLPMDLHEMFDGEVNNAIADGWRLTKRDVILATTQTLKCTYTRPRLYAELVKDDKPEPSEGIPWQQAMLAVRQMCDSNPSCSLCPAHYNCLNGAPHNWDMASLLGLEK